MIDRHTKFLVCNSLLARRMIAWRLPPQPSGDTANRPIGSVLLLTGQRNEPLGLRNAPDRTSSSSLPSPYPALTSRRPSHSIEDKKKTKDGAIILEPQPDDSHNDPLNWPAWRRDSALLSLGFYC